MLRRIGIGCGGLVALILVLGIIGAIISAINGGGGGSPTTPVSPSPPASPPSAPSPSVTPPAPPASDNKSAGTATIRVSGTPGIPFSGSYGTVTNGQTSVDGTLTDQPTEYQVPIKTGTFSFDAVSATFQKKSADGDLKAEIVANGATKKTQETTAQYGVVSLTWNTQE